MEKLKEKTPIDRIWDFFASVKLAIVIFALIGLTSIVGTVVEQQVTEAKNIEVISKIFGSSAAPAIYNALDALGFMDMYRSWWFTTLLGLFAANLLICSIDRFPAIWRLVRTPIKPLEKEHIKGMSIKREFVLKGSPDKLKAAAEAAMKAAGFRPSESKEAGEVQLYSEKGRMSRLGIYVTHFSILIILIGAIIGVFLGFKGGLNLPEGSSYSVAFARTGPATNEAVREREIIISATESAGGSVAAAAESLGVGEDRLRARMKELGMEPLDFIIRCDDFEVEFYDKSDMPKSYTSLLTVMDGGREVLKKWITVNDPLKYKGFTFYQSSYGLMPDKADVRFILRLTSPSGQSETLRVRQGEKFLIPGTKLEVTAADFSPALSFDEAGRPFTYNEMMNNPAVHLDITSAGAEEVHKWVLKRYPDTGTLASGHFIQLLDIWGGQYTGLQVRRDPGVWVVYLGCLLMSIGLYVVFFLSHRRIWISLHGAKGSVTVTLGASANKNREALERKATKIESLLREGGK
ncbi:MAG: cytochrome c biogenesis protein ResB [Thermodesulfovibrionales bacterium]|nr:cytochrome c biogenesis protein ResB [Thermodesulfovibrionales bacterium]